jgi:hypothetical protein
LALVGPVPSESSWVIVCMVLSILRRLKSFVCPVLVNAVLLRGSDQARRRPISYVRATCRLSLQISGLVRSQATSPNIAPQCEWSTKGRPMVNLPLRSGFRISGEAARDYAVGSTRQSSLWDQSIPSISRGEMECARTDKLVKIREGT